MDNESEETEWGGLFTSNLDVFKETFKHAPFSTCIFDAVGRYVWSNPAFQNVFGDGPPPPEFSFLEDPLIIAHGYKHHLDDLRMGKPARIPEIWYDVREHDPRFVHAHRVCVGGYVFPLKDDGGKIRCFFVFHDDATERELVREALEKSEERYRLLVEKAPIGIISIRRDGKIIEANPKLVEILGSLSRSLTLEINVLEHPPLVEAGIAGDVRACIQSAEPMANERPYVTLSEKKVFLRYLLTPSRISKGVVEEVQAVVEDITEPMRSREEALRADRFAAVGSLAAGIVHDFGNVLSGIAGLTVLLKNDGGLSDSSRRHVETIREAGDEARELIRSLKALSMEGNSISEEVDVHDLIREVCDLAQHALLKGIRIERDLNAGRSVLVGDPVHLHRALLNLAINAGQAMPEGGVLTFATSNSPGDGSCPGTVLEVRVRDTGEGMPAELRERIFDPFFSTREGEGAGMGLATVREAVKRHAGEIRVESKPGAGTTFTLRLPLAGL